MSSIYEIMVKHIIGDLKSIGLVVGVRGLGQLIGSLCYFPFIDIISITTSLRILTIFYTLSNT